MPYDVHKRKCSYLNLACMYLSNPIRHRYSHTDPYFMSRYSKVFLITYKRQKYVREMGNIERNGYLPHYHKEEMACYKKAGELERNRFTSGGAERKFASATELLSETAPTTPFIKSVRPTSFECA